MKEKPVASEETRKKLKEAFQKLRGTPFVKEEKKQNVTEKPDSPETRR